MFLTDAAKNAMLDAAFVSGASNMQLSLHSAYSATGANLIGSKTNANFAAGAGGVKDLAAACDIAVTAGNTVKWVGAWDSTGVTFNGMQPNGGSAKTFQLDLTNNRVYCEGSGYANDHKVVFYGAAAPTGLTAGTTYFVVGITAGDPDYFQVSATSGGAAIDITGQHAAGCLVSKIIEEAYGADGTHSVSSYSIAV